MRNSGPSGRPGTAPRAGLENQACQIAENQRRGGAYRACLKAARKQPQQPLFLHRLLDSLHQYVPEAQQRHARPRPGKFLKRLIQAENTDDRTGHYQQNHNAPRHHLRFLHKNLYQRAYQSAYPKGIYIIHHMAVLLYRTLILPHIPCRPHVLLPARGCRLPMPVNILRHAATAYG